MSRRPPVFLIRPPLAETVTWPMARSWMGGLPRLGDLDWPHRGGWALHFLAQIDMGDLARLAPLTGLPTSGRLAPPRRRAPHPAPLAAHAAPLDLRR